VGEYTLFPSTPLERRETVEELGAQDDANSNSKTSTTFSVIWVLVVEI
jgi:hypothetical protein